MIKRISKITGLLVCVASITSIIPAYSADIQKLDIQNGTIDSAKSKGNGIFIDGEINSDDEAVYWMSDDGKYNKLDVETGSSMTDELMNKYLEVDTGANDLTYLDITNDYKETDYDVREDLESTVARTIKSKLRHDDDGRFVKNTLENEDFTNISNRESSISPTSGKKNIEFVSAGDGLSIFQVPLKDYPDAGITRSTSATEGSLSSASSQTVQNTSAIYGDATGNYVDADYNLGSLKVYSGTTTGSSVTLKNTDDSYDITKDGQTYKLKAVLQEKSYIAEVTDTVYRWAYLTIYKKGPNDTQYSPVTESDGFVFGGSDKKDSWLDAAGTKTVLHKFSKTQSSDTTDGIKYSKDSTIYFVADKNGVDKSDSLLALNGGKMKANDKALCSYKSSNGTIYGENVIPSHKNNFNYLDIGDQDSSDIDTTSSLESSGGVPWFVNSGYIMTWDGDHSFVKFAKIDSGISTLSVGSKSKIIAWDTDKSVYSIINIPKAATSTTATTGAATTTTTTTTGAAVTISTTAQTGWVQSQTANTWNYILEDGTKKTGWLNNNNTWYYLSSNGDMVTGWINVDGTWYYLDESGAMLSDTTVNGYVLDSDGAWIQ